MERQNFKGLTLESKRLAMEALAVRVWIDGDRVETEGAIPITDLSFVSRSVT